MSCADVYFEYYNENPNTASSDSQVKQRYDLFLYNVKFYSTTSRQELLEHKVPSVVVWPVSCFMGWC